MFSVVFPGQGSQAVGMAADFASRFPEAREALEEADAAFGAPLSRWISEGPEERLRRTEVTQPAILAASIAIYRVLASRLNADAAFVAGHSLGEYTALVAAGALDLADAVALVRQRGAFMQEAVPEGEGAMLAVMGLPPDEVARVCEKTEGAVAPANYNSPVQTVIAGATTAVAAAAEALRAAGAKRLIELEVSAPFHCELMAPARDQLVPVLAETPFRDARIPVIANVDARAYRSPEDARERLREQVCAPVRWVECVEELVRQGSKLVLEVGPGKVLSGLVARIDRRVARAHVGRCEELEPALAAVSEASA